MWNVKTLQTKHFFRLSIFGVLGIAALLWVKAGEIYHEVDSFDGAVLPEVDVILCLVGGRGRIVAASDLWYRYHEVGRVTPILYFAGVDQKMNANSLIGLFRPGVARDFRNSDLFFESFSKDTNSNMEVFVDQLIKQNWKKVMLMTSRYHMARSRRLLEFYLNRNRLSDKVQIVTSSVVQDPFDGDDWRWSWLGIRVTIDEFLKYKWVNYRFRQEPLL